MPTYQITCINLDSKKVKTDSLENNKVSLDNSDTPLKVKNNKGEVVFWVDNDGASIKQLETKTKFVELLDTPDTLNDGILTVDNNNFKFTKDLNANSLNAKNINCEQITTSLFKTENINLVSLVAKSVLGNKITCDDINTASLLATKIHNENLESNNIKCKKLFVDDLSLKDIHFSELHGEKSYLNNASINNASIDKFNSNNSNIKNLEVSNATVNSLKVNDINLDEINLKKATIDKLLVNDLQLLNDKLHVYGSLDNPLLLASTKQKSLKLNNGKSHKIYIKLIENIIVQTFSIENLPEHPKLSNELYGENVVNTMLCHTNNNNLINIHLANRCKPNNILVLYINA